MNKVFVTLVSILWVCMLSLFFIKGLSEDIKLGLFAFFTFTIAALVITKLLINYDV